MLHQTLMSFKKWKRNPPAFLMEDRVNRDSYSTVPVTKDKLSPERDESQLISVWSFIHEDQSSGEAEEEPTVFTKSRLYLVGLGIFVALVTTTLIYMSVKMATVLENIKDLKMKKSQLLLETTIMERQINALTLEIDKECGPCPDDWILFNQKCYMFYDEAAPWKTWEESRRFCQDRGADLLAIGDLAEQKFINKHIKYYQSEYHGYWIGLQHVNNTWTWVDGRRDTLGFWAKNTVTSPGPKALVIPSQNPSESWKKENNVFMNKFICEHKARLRSN
ncbi:CD209 antigen-like protein E isoform X1 [Xiphophorus couchianus]|uniref:CD209 antigen-like protein E isoform X1 n=2 Tax=Xiphophorus couchianus TaxID=32473 RepID=UPI0010163436|nr:CD209 antigen-like protein E isoform X1 [Xiphophorus couchianus]